jgi:hypothetical protein
MGGEVFQGMDVDIQEISSVWNNRTFARLSALFARRPGLLGFGEVVAGKWSRLKSVRRGCSTDASSLNNM